MQYRLTANYKDANFISTRVSDKVVITALMMLLYWGKGNDLRVTNLLNVSTLLYMWAMLPAFSAAAYVPTLVLERPLYTRHAPYLELWPNLSQTIQMDCMCAPEQ